MQKETNSTLHPFDGSHLISVVLNTDAPLLKLMGHVSAITDLAYSHAGDRILSASQKDGVVRVWSLGMNFGSLATHGGIDERGVSQIVIKLTNPASSSKPKLARRRRPGSADRTEATKVSCDVAVWTHDDSRIITSQCVLLKQSGTEIQPGSQFIFLWESRTGHCLLGISGAHAMQCPVIIPHPDDASIVCSAGADGMAKVWDWETGRCIFSHQNKIEFGPTDPNDNSKISGYLDGAFRADGTCLVLTDDNGRITILDSLVPSEGGDDRSTPLWMREQYFGNDYYELFYDTNGYCIERGSEQPPHIAPRGVRANHSGSAYPDEINEAFRKMTGPMPLPEHTCGWRRERMRGKGRFAGRVRESLVKARDAKVRRGVREFDPLTTIIIRADGHVDKQVASRAQHEIEVAATAASGADTRGNGSSSRALSSNYRYMDYEDLVRREGEIDPDEMDTDDEEFEPAAARTASRLEENSDEDDDLDLDEIEGESPFRPTVRRTNEHSGERREVRAQRRTQRRDDQFVELGSDDEMVEQFMSTNNTPSGEYIRDFNITGHFWRLTGSGHVRRKWLSRHESETSYDGRKTYSPQLGDSIVYIPRAHFETINEFPSFTPPWQRWPQGTVWPVVRCSIRGIRYRFPYEDYFRGGQ
jgi:WD40 repeat protein